MIVNQYKSARVREIPIHRRGDQRSVLGGPLFIPGFLFVFFCLFVCRHCLSLGESSLSR